MVDFVSSPTDPKVESWTGNITTPAQCPSNSLMVYEGYAGTYHRPGAEGPP